MVRLGAPAAGRWASPGPGNCGIKQRTAPARGLWRAGQPGKRPLVALQGETIEMKCFVDKAAQAVFSQRGLGADCLGPLACFSIRSSQPEVFLRTSSEEKWRSSRGYELPLCSTALPSAEPIPPSASGHRGAHWGAKILRVCSYSGPWTLPGVRGRCRNTGWSWRGKVCAMQSGSSSEPCLAQQNPGPGVPWPSQPINKALYLTFISSSTTHTLLGYPAPTCAADKMENCWYHRLSGS